VVLGAIEYRRNEEDLAMDDLTDMLKGMDMMELEVFGTQ
jgi:hypothetical protein